ncbi:hypothetical protein K7432_004113 [Basidiobolus ranarum]|uniref:Uncharacterized protein n=1 Tax=Basidiobolus ranarum TaxID=34480 RepID=A0ABR2WYU5_9FUNG
MHHKMDSTDNTVFILDSNPACDFAVLRFITSCYTASLVDSFIAIPAIGPAKRVKNVASLLECISLLPFNVLPFESEIFEKSLTATYEASSDIVDGGLESNLTSISQNLVIIIGTKGRQRVSTHLASKSSILGRTTLKGKKLEYQWCLLPHLTTLNPSSVAAPCYMVKDHKWLHGTTEVRVPSPLATYILSIPTASFGLQNWPWKLEFIPNTSAEEGNDTKMTLGSRWLRQVVPLHKIVLTTFKVNSTGIAEFVNSNVGNAMLHSSFLSPPPEGENTPGIEGDIYLPVVAPQPVYGSLEQLLKGSEQGWLPIDDVDITSRGDYIVGWTGMF